MISLQNRRVLQNIEKIKTELSVTTPYLLEEFLTTEHDIDGHYNIHIQMLKYCPMGCPGCYQEELSSKEHIQIDKIKEYVINILEKVKPETYKLTFFGGEPLLRISSIFEILKWVKGFNNTESTLKEICMPTSGTTGLKADYGLTLKNNIDKFIEYAIDLDVKLSISISHDGPNNLVHRNIEDYKINDLNYYIKEKEEHYNLKILPTYISCVIPQNIDEDYFTDTFLYFLDHLGKPGTFTIPHILDKTGNLFKEPIIFRNSINKFISRYYGTQYWEMAPKIFKDMESKFKHKHKFNWCGAGLNHSALTPEGIKDCEYIKGSGPVLLNKMDQYCNKCEIKDYCQRPCLKNMEVETDNFLAQCKLRKIIFNELSKAIHTQTQTQKQIN